MRLSYEQWRALDSDECVEGYRDGSEGWPVRQGASVAYRWGHDNGRVDFGHQSKPKNNVHELLAEMRRRGDSLL